MRTSLTALLLGMSLLLSGCTRPGSTGGSLYTNYRDLEALRPVQTLGLDGGETVTVTAAGGEGSPLLQASGDSLPQAMELLRRQSEGALFFPHTRFLLLGEEKAGAGPEQLWELFRRSGRARLDLPLFVVRGGEAGDLMEAGDCRISARLAAVERDGRESSGRRVYTLLDVLLRLRRSGAALLCAVDENGTAGYGVLRENRLRGYLNPGAAQGVDLLTDRAGAASVALPCRKGTVTVMLEEGRVRPVPERTEEGPLVRYTVFLEARIQSAPEDFGPSDLPGLERALRQWLCNHCESALRASRRMDADFLEVGLCFRRAMPREWETLREDFLQRLRWELDCRVRVGGLPGRKEENHGKPWQ